MFGAQWEAKSNKIHYQSEVFVCMSVIIVGIYADKCAYLVDWLLTQDVRISETSVHRDPQMAGHQISPRFVRSQFFT